MSAFACVTCGDPVTAMNGLAQRLMEKGGKMPMCTNCRAGRSRPAKAWNNYDEYLKSPEWKALADRRKRIDGYKCRLCNGSERLEVHHRDYSRLYHEDIEDLTTLCKECHTWYSAWVKSKKNGRQLVGFAPVEFKL